ncbi:MAG: aminotransferase class III-fold pyridoxal phosphate-dependent enzyme, partial [Acidobacteria bacterium]|nr:aminotransferase class III-fold pyridoxal phosphate-dependent enzyme [Acidobacteriota bacterium]
GIGVASLGHANPQLAEAWALQAGELLHTSILFFLPLQGGVAERLARLSGLPRAFFCNSGTEAVEACLKFARRYWRTRGADDRHEIVAFEGAFHGRTFGSLSVTAGEPYRTPFAPLLPGIRFVSRTDPGGVRDAVTDRTAAVIVEPIQGEGGIRPIPRAAAAAIGEACAATGTLLIADEIQCGLGRTGHPFHSAALGLTPDLISVGKSLGGGFPVAAALMSEAVAAAVAYGDHGSTYGGNLLACRAALVFLEALEDGLLERVAAAGRRFRHGLEALVAESEAIHEVRGDGLMWGIEVDPAVADRAVDCAIARGLVINRTAGTVVRLLPPLNISDDDIDDGLRRLRLALDDAGAALPAA